MDNHRNISAPESQVGSNHFGTKGVPQEEQAVRTSDVFHLNPFPAIVDHLLKVRLQDTFDLLSSMACPPASLPVGAALSRSLVDLKEDEHRRDRPEPKIHRVFFIFPFLSFQAVGLLEHVIACLNRL